jgi:hypothetical protein
MRFSIEEVLFTPSDAEEDLVKTEAVASGIVEIDAGDLLDDGRGWDSEHWIG